MSNLLSTNVFLYQCKATNIEQIALYTLLGTYTQHAIIIHTTNTNLVPKLMVPFLILAGHIIYHCKLNYISYQCLGYDGQTFLYFHTSDNYDFKLH